MKGLMSMCSVKSIIGMKDEDMTDTLCARVKISDWVEHEIDDSCPKHGYDWEVKGQRDKSRLYFTWMEKKTILKYISHSLWKNI